MNELQKKVLVFLLKQLDEMVSEWSCDEGEVPGLSTDERLELTKQLWTMWGDIEDWDEEPYMDFGLSSLSSLAQMWLGEPYKYAKKEE